jgi:maltose O-acetyltransferase
MTLGALAKQTTAQRKMRKRGATLGSPCYLSDIRTIQGGCIGSLIVGSNSYIGRVGVALHDSVSIGNFVCINDGAVLLTGTHDVNHPSWPLITKPIVIEDYAWIATGAMILPGVTVGYGAVVGAGAVVAKNVPAMSIVTGNPAQIISTRQASEFTYNPTRRLALYEAWLGPSL